MEKLNIFTVVIQILILNSYILVGFLIRKKGILTNQGTDELSKLLINIVFPIFLFKGFSMPYDPKYNKTMAVMCVMVLLYLLLAYIMGTLTARKFTNNEVDKRTFIYNTIFGNIAFLGFPICYSMFGQKGIFFASMFVLIQNLFQWTIGVNLIQPQKNLFSSLKFVIQPPLIAVLSGLAVYFLNYHPSKELSTYLFSPINQFMTTISGMAVPVALIVTGATLYGFKPKDIIGNMQIQAASILKTILFPLIFVIIILVLPLHLLIGKQYAFMMKSIITIQAAGPLQSSSTAFIRTYGGNDELTARVVFLSTLYCIFSIPFYLILVNL